MRTLPLRGTRERERGQIMVVFALVIVVVLMFAALVIDLGVLRNNRQILANTFDAAALAGGTLMPVDGSVAPTGANPGSQANLANTRITDSIKANYPSLPASAYQITYKCLIGSSGGVPLISRDVPGVCNPRHALGHVPVAADFTGAGSTRSSACDPFAGDKCNVVLVTGYADTSYTLGRVVGIDSGSTGAVSAASCAGPCGAAPALPVDVVMILDRTGSMSGDGIQNPLGPPITDIYLVQQGAAAVLSVFDPKVQRVALGTIGPSRVSAGVPDVANCPNTWSAWYNTPVYGVGQVPASLGSDHDFVTRPKWIPVEFTGLDALAGITWHQAYSSNGVVNQSTQLMRAISCFTSYTQGTNLDTPVAMAQQYLMAFGRPGVKKGIIVETDGTPEAGDGSIHYTCGAADATAAAVKAAGTEIFTIGYGVGNAKCPSLAANPNETEPGRSAAALLASMATDASHFYNQPAGQDLTAAFTQVALSLATGKPRLVSLYPIPVVTSVNPSTASGGATVTISGSYFTGATTVSFGGAPAAFVITSDTSITATAPAGTSGQTVNIKVTTPGGTSTSVAGDRFTYN